MTIQVHRDADLRICGASTIVTGQTTVFANDRLISVEGDTNTHGGGQLIATGGGSVFIEGKKMIVVGNDALSDNRCDDDYLHCAPKSSTGSSDVLAF